MLFFDIVIFYKGINKSFKTAFTYELIFLSSVILYFRKVIVMYDILKKCGSDRYKGKGFCGAGAEVLVAKACLHHWEEPCISGCRGSGAVFFSGCNMKCVYRSSKRNC
jgi:hypothetical protein